MLLWEYLFKVKALEFNDTKSLVARRDDWQYASTSPSPIYYRPSSDQLSSVRYINR